MISTSCDRKLTALAAVMLAVLMLAFLLVTSAWAVPAVTFEWDPYVDAQLVDGFRLYERGKADPVTARTKAAEFASGTTTQGTSVPAALGERCWVLTAFSAAQNLESDPSNEVCAVVRPNKPIKIKIINATVEVSGEIVQQ
jgi:hypothetical protein